MTLLSPIGANVTEVWAAQAVLGECPTWDAETGRLYWIDIKGRQLHAYGHHDGTRKSWPLPFRLSSLARAAHPWRTPKGLAGDAFIGCGDPGLTWIGVEDRAVSLVPIVHPERNVPGNRFNDGKLGPDGRYWAGTMDDREQVASGRLYAFSPDGSYQVMDEGYLVANGPAFSPDGRSIYHNDSALRRIYAFDMEPDGRLGPRHLLKELAAADGCPDGMTVDTEGNLWIALWDGYQVLKLGPDGSRLGAVAMPAARCTSCAFVEPNVLYVTSATIGLEDQASAGSLFRVELL